MLSFQKHVKVVKDLYPKSSDWPGEVKEIMVNMAFNLGGRLKQFTGLTAGLAAKNWTKAADNMLDSSWYCQVKCRAVRLIARMRKMANKEDNWGVCMSKYPTYNGKSCCSENNGACFKKCFKNRKGAKCKKFVV